MNYNKIYQALVLKGQQRVTPEVCEVHHIMPKCVGGNDNANNLVSLTPEEHYVAHLLLVKIYPGEAKLWYAANMMNSRVNNNKQYGWLKRNFVKMMSEDRKGQQRTANSRVKQSATCRAKYANGYVHPRLGRSNSEAHNEAISAANVGKNVPVESRSSLEGFVARYGEVEGHDRYNNTNLKKSSMSLDGFVARCGEVEGQRLYNERVEIMKQRTGKSNHMYGKTHSVATKQLQSEAAKSRPTITCHHCGKVGSANIMPRWHFDNCKRKA
jgi:hypothetical protein